MPDTVSTLKFQPHTPEKSSSPLCEALSFASTKDCALFHATVPGYKETPLYSMDDLARRLHLGKIFLKDESARFELGAFKVLGASYAIARQLAKKLRLDPSSRLVFTELAKEAKKQASVMECITASDGNHGFAVAWFCKLLGIKATVLLPKGNAELRAPRIRRLGAQVEVIDGSYDDAVREADRRSKTSGAELVQDTAWDGYEEIPLDIMRGYCTIVHEIVHELVNDIVADPAVRPTHVFLQAGVGSFASAMAACLSSVFFGIRIVIVEPCSVSSLYETASTNDGILHSTGSAEETCMTSLNCATPSNQAWEILQRKASGFIACGDGLALLGRVCLTHPEGNDALVNAGFSGAVTTGVLGAVSLDAGLGEVRQWLGLDDKSKVLLISTEGDIDSME